MSRYTASHCVAEPLGGGIWVITTAPRGILDVEVMLDERAGDHTWATLVRWDPMALPDPDAPAANEDGS